MALQVTLSEEEEAILRDVFALVSVASSWTLSNRSSCSDSTPHSSPSIFIVGGWVRDKVLLIFIIPFERSHSQLSRSYQRPFWPSWSSTLLPQRVPLCLWVLQILIFLWEVRGATGKDLDLMVDGVELDDVVYFLEKFGRKLEVLLSSFPPPFPTLTVILRVSMSFSYHVWHFIPFLIWMETISTLLVLRFLLSIFLKEVKHNLLLLLFVTHFGIFYRFSSYDLA